MSVEAVSWALGTKCGSSTAKLLLLLMCERASWKEPRPRVRWKARPSGERQQLLPAWHVCPSVQWLADASELDRKTVIKGLKQLEARGYITQVGTAGLTSQIPVYVVNLNSTESGIDTENGTVPESAAKGAVLPSEECRFSLETVPNAVHGTVLNRTEPSKEPVARKRALPEGFEVSEEVRAWAGGEGIGDELLSKHFEHFVGASKASGLKYVDWDEALMSSIRADWGQIRKNWVNQHGDYETPRERAARERVEQFAPGVAARRKGAPSQEPPQYVDATEILALREETAEERAKSDAARQAFVERHLPHKAKPAATEER